MKQVSEKLYGNLTSRQRLVATWEAIGRGDEAEVQRLQDTAPRFSFTGPDSSITQSWTSILSIGLGVEVDMRGCALTFQMALRAGETEIAISSLQKLKAIDARWGDILKELGLSDAAIKAARPESHPMIDLLLAVAKNHEPEIDEDLEDYFAKVRKMIPVM